MKSAKAIISVTCFLVLVVLFGSCMNLSKESKKKIREKVNMGLTAKDILGNKDYLAISYGGYREKSREQQPQVAQLKEDILLLHAMGIRIIRTYNVQLDHAGNVLKAIKELKEQDPNFEMYVMLGAWIDCKNAWTGQAPDHNQESKANAAEIDRAVALANKYPEIIKIIAVGNEAMVKWATSYYVQPDVILKWVNHLQDLKKNGKLSKDMWITSSDNFASWGGGGDEYHVKALDDLIKAVDYISMHTYPMHDTHYNPQFWNVPAKDVNLSKLEKVNTAMKRSQEYAKSQYDSVKNYMTSLGVDKPIHIGETGWASVSTDLYGDEGSKACDEYKEGLYYELMRDWTNENGISCFYFEAFDEQWKDAGNPLGSENHFGLITLEGQAKYAIWDLVDDGVFKGLTRNGNKITKTYNGKREQLLADVKVPPSK